MDDGVWWIRKSHGQSAGRAIVPYSPGQKKDPTYVRSDSLRNLLDRAVFYLLLSNSYYDVIESVSVSRVVVVSGSCEKPLFREKLTSADVCLLR